MLHNTYTAKGRAIARTLSTSFLRDETRIVASIVAGIRLVSERGGSRELHYPLRVARWVERALSAVPVAPDSARLTAPDSVCCVTIRTAAGVTFSGLYEIASVWFLYRGLLHWNISSRKQLQRTTASLRRRLREGQIKELVWLAANGGEGRTV